ncbi:ABC transporter ATP-binding protein [Endothiovibrio diazotrophicus]
MSDVLIRVEHLYRHFGETMALRNVSFELHKGEVLGFLGPNGAGKTTTMRILSGNLAPSAGRVEIDGVDLLDEPKRAKASLGYLPEQPPLYREQTVDEYLGYCARLNRIPGARIKGAVERAKERCGLTEVGRRLIGNLSKGYQQRVGIAQAIIHTPAVVILDEPTVGLDPIQIREIRELIRELGRDHGVILSTHILPEVQAACSRVQIIHRGELVYSDSIEGLDHRLEATSLLIDLQRPPALDELSGIDDVGGVEPAGEGRFHIRFAPGHSPAARLAETAAERGWGLTELTPERATLEQIFVNLTCGERPHPENGHPAEATR